ncbi:T9SS type A sorting domain-containing protein [Aquimarina sp. ERC-38]|uniref:T9SS type A sorting domain-containing protein n=1 Tax=Aquimarina sp. ERC-38 TaxID=2949996 RepID=UPI00224623B9|nr:T9SS type A sorting domain-containing protein [Aquimarina sp. ERC-38]UZO82601.1 T9SS type A sorting domain-containing protein [Aquimarina sp. ERC-38]
MKKKQMKLKNTIRSIAITMLVFSFSELQAQVNVDINFDVNHTLDVITSFDREKFITCHSDPSDNDFNGELDKLDYLINDLDVYFGRETGRMRFQVNQVIEDPARPGFASPSDMTRRGNQSRNNYARNTSRHAYEKGNLMTAAQDVPFYPNGNNATSRGWVFSQTDTPSEPFGTATGEYMGRFLRDYHGTGGATGDVKPLWVEVMNEPVWPLVDVNLHGGGTIENIFKMHNSVADEIKRFSPDTKVGGFTTAFPEFEKNGRQENAIFGQWEERWKRFIDEAGPKMDFYSIHLYDFPGIRGGLEQYRKGGNMEATMDMIEHYNTIVYGDVKPWVISEYASQLHDWFNQPWSAFRDWLFLKAQSSMLMQFMERANVIEKTIPFTVMKAEWGFGNFSNNGFPYYWRMMRRANEPNDYSGDWIWTEYIKFYELWSDVKGVRVDTRSTDPDLMVDAYVNNNKAYLILNNIDETNLNVNLNEFGLNGNVVSEVKIKHLYLGLDNTPKLDTVILSEIPDDVTVNKESCMIVEYTFNTPVVVNESSTEVKTYAMTYKQPIVANTAISFTISNISKGSFGEGILRLGIGREKNRVRIPVVSVNGNAVIVSSDYRGDDQKDRNRFFGMLEIPVSNNVLNNGNNIINVTFPDNGGFVSSCALQIFEFSKNIVRTSNNVQRDRSITFNNRTSFNRNGSSDPLVEFGQVMDINVTYKTGITGGTEEDLTYIATQVRQVDGSGNTVNNSAFTSSIPGTADNTGTFTYQYTVPDKFSDDTDIPSFNDLPSGHRLLLLIFMSVDGDSNFANANDTIIITDNVLSVEEVTDINTTIQLYPNPALDNVYLKGDFDTWQLFSATGALLLNGKDQNIDTSNLASGLYFINFDNTKQSIKFVKY